MQSIVYIPSSAPKVDDGARDQIRADLCLIACTQTFALPPLRFYYPPLLLSCRPLRLKHLLLKPTPACPQQLLLPPKPVSACPLLLLLPLLQLMLLLPQLNLSATWSTSWRTRAPRYSSPCSSLFRGAGCSRSPTGKWMLDLDVWFSSVAA